MRTSTIGGAVFAAALTLAGGCAPDCGPAAQIGSNTYSVFSHPISASGDNLELLTSAPDFASYSLPVNGESSWSFKFGNADDGPMKVAIDGQEFDAHGSWDSVECGNFIVSDFAGQFVSTDGTQHNFSAVMNMVVWGEQLEGLVQWGETWTLTDGTAGSYKSTTQMRGLLASGGSTGTGTTGTE